MNTFERIYENVKRIPRGKVATYGMIAAMSGNPRLARVVGYALHVNPEPGVIPCHRVVTEREKLPPLLHSAARICNENFLKKKALCSVMTEQSIWMYI